MEPQSDAVRAQSGYSALTEKQLRVSTAVGPSTRIITLYSGVSRHVASKSKAAPLQGLNQPVTDMKRLWSPAPQIISSHFPRPSSHPFHGQSFQPSASSTHRRREGKKRSRLSSSNQIHSLARPSKHSSLYFSRWPFTAARLTRPVLRLPTDLLVSQTEAASARQRPDQALPLLDYRPSSKLLALGRNKKNRPLSAQDAQTACDATSRDWTRPPLRAHSAHEAESLTHCHRHCARVASR